MLSGLAKHIEDVVDTKNLKKDIDYRIVSISVVDDFDLMEDKSLDEVVGMNTLDFYNKNKIKNNFSENVSRLLIEGKYVEGENSVTVTETPDVECRNFYLPCKEIDFDKALTFFFGVVEMLTGRYKGRYMLYNMLFSTEDEDSDYDDIIDEMLMLKMYLQYSSDIDLEDEGLEDAYNTNRAHLKFLILKNKDKVMNKFDKLYLPVSVEKRVDY